MTKKLPGVISPLTILVIGLIIGIGATFAYFKLQSKINSPNQPSLTSPSPFTSPKDDLSSEASAKDETANWKTRKTDFYLFKYPSDWEEAKEYVTGGYFSVGPPGNKKIGLLVKDFTYINASDTPEKLSDQALAKGEVLLSRKNTVVDGHQAIIQERKGNNGGALLIEVRIGDVKQVSNFLPQDGGPRLTSGTQLVKMQIDQPTDVDTYRKLFNHILSTFKFLD